MNKNLPVEYRESLQALFIKRAYWAMNSVHNKIFFNEVGKTYTVPDREDKIVTLLTNQDPNEVALLRLTREILKKAEKEQPEKKLNINIENQNLTTEAEREQIQYSPNKEQQMITERNEEESIERKQEVKRNIKEENESVENQEETNTSQRGE